ncbi:uncharacterized protein LOC111057961 [Nilaparvata lugens]|uniref:uncharacterized protein LOC111057961 n=1 Tax=Nilaparvata lugens TaxID=108931 RepID=UPI00193DCFCD|nr:uncharacterized protein LOC111057961 [Nilaparvata lugens]
MHISTICLLTIFLPSIAVGSMPESKSWAEFESMMKGGGSYCLTLVYDFDKSQLDIVQAYCNNYTTVKCYYGMEGAENHHQPDTSFNTHFKNRATPFLAFFKNGQQVTVIGHTVTGVKSPEINAAFETVK